MKHLRTLRQRGGEDVCEEWPGKEVSKSTRSSVVRIEREEPGAKVPGICTYGCGASTNRMRKAGHMEDIESDA